MSEIENTWLQALTREIATLPTAAREDIVRDYREHFSAAREAGRSDAEIAEKLGDARNVGRSHAASERISAVEKSPSVMSRSWGLLGIVKALLILAPLNFIVVLGPFIIACILLFAGWFVSGLFVCISLAMIAHGLASIVHIGSDLALSVSGIFLFIASLAGSTLLVMIMWTISSWFSRAALAYCKWNVRFVTGQGDSHV